MKLKSILFSALGLLFLALGAIGIFVPVLPTTPFVLAAAGCFTYNPALRARVMKLPFFREYLHSYQEKNGLPRKTVIRSLTFLWGMLLISGIYLRSIWAALGFLVIGTAVTIHILWVAKPRGKRGAKARGREKGIWHF